MADIITDNTFISKAKPADISMDYTSLRAEGLAYLQNIASDIWTDYNDHDPGVTILEALVYAITDLGARANKPIEDLLVTKQQPAGEKDFFSAEEILPSNAITLSDYRKILIDLDAIRNAWLFKSTSSEQQIYLNRTTKKLTYDTGDSLPLNGLYNVLLEFEEDDVLGDLNSSIVSANIEILIGGNPNPVEHVIEVAFPFWDEISATWTQNITLNSITLQDVPGMPGKKLRELETGIRFIFFAVLQITYNGAQTDQIGVTIQLTSVMQDAATELPLVEAGIINKLQDITGTSISKEYNLKIIAANNILNTVKAYLFDNRNLSEDFYAFKATRIQEIGIKAEIQLASGANAEQILAQLFFGLDQFFSPPIRFYSLQEMLAQGKSTDEIYDGPLLKNGFILDEDLIELKRENIIYTSDLVRIIMNLNSSAGVVQSGYSGQNKKIISVQGLTITNYINNQVITANVRNCLSLTLIDIYKPKLSIGKSNITITKDGVEVSYDESKVVAAFKLLESAQMVVNKVPASLLPLPAGNYLAVDTYYSIQNDFPQTYGISYVGLSNTATELRKAQAKQLKGFLLFFEQLLANYLSQLSHIKDLFSIDAGVDDTYFWQPVNAVPDVAPLLQATYATAIPQLLKTLEQPASGSSRRNNFLDHLLGQFGEDFTDFALLMYAKYNDAATETLIKDKATFLQEYATLSYNRAKSYNYSGAAWDTDNVAGLKKRISRLLGIASYNQQSLSGTTDEGFHIVEHILLRPKVNDASSGTTDDFLQVDVDADGNIIEGKKDPYSFRLSFIFPDWPERFADADFKRYIEKIVQRETPAHILAEIYWLEQPAMQTFETAFKAWLTITATATDPDLVTPAKNNFIAVLNSL